MDHDFYKESLLELRKLNLPFMLGGTFAVRAYTGIERDTKDMDIFVMAGDYPKILNHFKDLGYRTEIEDERWLAKIFKDKSFIDLIFNSTNGITPVSDKWIQESATTEVYGVEVSVLPPTELIWAKAFVADRYKFDGADIAHVILKQAGKIHWERLLSYFEQYWEVLLWHILNFRFIYPSERELIPASLLKELIERLNEQMKLPTVRKKVCRGRLFSRGDYQIDIDKWGFADLIGEAQEVMKE